MKEQSIIRRGEKLGLKSYTSTQKWARKPQRDGTMGSLEKNGLENRTISIAANRSITAVGFFLHFFSKCTKKGAISAFSCLKSQRKRGKTDLRVREPCALVYRFVIC